MYIYTYIYMYIYNYIYVLPYIDTHVPKYLMHFKGLCRPRAGNELYKRICSIQLPTVLTTDLFVQESAFN